MLVLTSQGFYAVTVMRHIHHNIEIASTIDVPETYEEEKIL